MDTINSSHGIAIHGAIDGNSRKLLWLEACYSNNDPHIIAGYYLSFVKRISRVPRPVEGMLGLKMLQFVIFRKL